MNIETHSGKYEKEIYYLVTMILKEVNSYGNFKYN